MFPFPPIFCTHYSFLPRRLSQNCPTMHHEEVIWTSLLSCKAILTPIHACLFNLQRIISRNANTSWTWMESILVVDALQGKWPLPLHMEQQGPGDIIHCPNNPYRDWGKAHSTSQPNIALTHAHGCNTNKTNIQLGSRRTLLQSWNTCLSMLRTWTSWLSQAVTLIKKHMNALSVYPVLWKHWCTSSKINLIISMSPWPHRN